MLALARLGGLCFLYFIPILLDIEDAVGDLVLGNEAEKLRELAAEFELSERYFENACEAP